MDIHRTLYTTRGACAAVAGALDISQAAVSQWRLRGIPADRLPAVTAALKAYLDTLGIIAVEVAS
jgi:hypothetical protein